MQLDIFQISESATLRDALQCIERNCHGIIFVTDASGAVSGVATDGDIRRRLLDGGSMEDIVNQCATSDFVWEKPTAPRESLLKKLDHRIRVIPLLDDRRRLVGFVSRDHMPLEPESSIYARARAPVRISFGGGGSDLTHYFANNVDGAVINTTISMYSHATLRMHSDQSIIINSFDLQHILHAENLADALAQSGRFGLIQALLKTIKPDFGFELFIQSDFPMNSGLGGSAAAAAAVLGCFNQFRRDQWDLYELSEIAYQSERHSLNVAGGWQDQYATIFGGFNFMEFRMDQNIIHPLRIHHDNLLELEESLILCDTGISHDSGDIHSDQREQMVSNKIREMVERNVGLSYEMRNNLLRGRLSEFGELLDKAWQLKRQLSKKISSTHLDKVYDGAKAHGALGGKLLGAGGGGFFLFYVSPFRKYELLSYLNSMGLHVRPFRFEQQGLQAWTVRESIKN